MNDYFVSYNRHDRDWAEWIAWQLEEAGYAVVIQAWDFLPGENFALGMHRAAQEARRTIAVLSQTYLASLYTQPEWAAAFSRDPTSSERTLLPVRVRDCQPAGLLASIVFVDLVGLPPDEARARLLAAVQGDRAKPAASPAFPGQARAGPAFPASPGPRPSYRDQFIREIGDRAEQLRKTRRELVVRRAGPEEIRAVEQQLLELKRQLRDGPRLQAGDCLSNRYVLVEELGSGGFATVWQAYDEERKALVALKVLHGQHGGSAERIERFWRGARAMQQLQHPNIVRILETRQEDGGYHYFVMEHVTGGTFDRAVTNGTLTVEERFRVVREVGDALVHAHERQFLHRDVKPANILLDGATGSARLTDFDLVRVPDSTGGTRTGALGTFLYAAPECMESAGDGDHRCDIYSLGMTAVFALHGKKLPHAALRQWDRFLEGLDCPRRVKAVLARATAGDPDERFATMKEFCAALAEAFTSPPADPGPSREQSETARLAAGVLQGLRTVHQTAKEVLHRDLKPTTVRLALDNREPPVRVLDFGLARSSPGDSCPVCQVTANEVRESGRLGCLYDYTRFNDQLVPLLENLHGETRHVGNLPPALSGPRDERGPRHVGLWRQMLDALNAADHRRFMEAKEALRQELRPVGKFPSAPRAALDALLGQPGEWLRGSGPESDVVISTRVRLARNLACFPFGPHCSADDRGAILELLRGAIGTPKDGLYFDLRELPALDRQVLVERQVISREQAVGEGPRGVLVDGPERLNILINEEDHLRIGMTASGLNFDCAGDLAGWDEKIGSAVGVAFHPRFGYATTSPTNVGTGMRISVLLHLPALTLSRQVEKVLRALAKINLRACGLYGDGSRASGDFYQIANGVTLGRTEEQIVADAAAVIPQIIHYERQARQALLRDNPDALRDRVSRAAGTLAAASMITSEETMELLSQLRLGVVLGVIDTPTLPAIHELLLHTQPGHLQKLMGAALDAEERNAARARYLRGMLRGGK